MTDKFQCFIFDLDGTLVDSVDDLKNAFNYMRRQFGYPEVTREKMEKIIGNGMRDVIVQSFAEMNISASDEEITNALNIMFNYYLEHTVEQTKPYDGVAETLEYLKARGCKLAVVTNKFTKATMEILRVLSLDKYFDKVYGNGEGFPLKPAPDLLWETAKRLELPIESCVMVGDNYTDLGAARRAGCKSIFARYGYGVMQDEKTDFFIDNFAELKAFAL